MQAAANLYIPRFAEGGRAKPGIREAGVGSATAPARPLDEPLSPFETVRIGGGSEKPLEKPEKAIEAKKVLPSCRLHG